MFLFLSLSYLQLTSLGFSLFPKTITSKLFIPSCLSSFSSYAILCGAVGKNPPSNAGDAQGTWVRTLDREDPLEEELATHSSILARKITYGQRSLVGYSPWGCKELGITEHIGTRPIPWGL